MIFKPTDITRQLDLVFGSRFKKSALTVIESALSGEKITVEPVHPNPFGFLIESMKRSGEILTEDSLKAPQTIIQSLTDIPELLFCPMSLDQARIAIKRKIITNVIGCLDVKTKIKPDDRIVAVCATGNFFRHFTEADTASRYQEVMEGSAKEEVEKLFWGDSIPHNAIIYWIDQQDESFWVEAITTTFTMMGGSAFSQNPQDQERILTVPNSTEQDEFFTDQHYRLDPGDYNTPLPFIRDQMVFSPEAGSNLLVKPIENVGRLIGNTAFPYPQTYYRVFRSQPERPKSNALIFIQTYLASYLTEQEVLLGLPKIEIKLPGVTGWMSANTPFIENNFQGLDGQGIFMSYGTRGLGILEVTFNQFSTNASELQAIIRITYENATVPILSRVSFVDWRNLYQGNTN